MWLCLLKLICCKRKNYVYLPDNRYESIENTKIEINYNEDDQLDSEFQDSNENFKDSLLHLINHFNTKIKGCV